MSGESWIDDDVTALGFRLHGRVQGVSFRWFARGAAQELGVRGWIRNRTDGDVEGEAFASPAVLRRFLERLRQGPPSARVDTLKWRRLDESAIPTGFEIRR